MGQANKKIRKSEENQQRPARTEFLQSRQLPTDLTFHIVTVADFI